jgi:Raf kinase inhibitor-like YbhB/YbcL family protein
MSRALALSATLIGVAGLAACKDDGRTLREPRPDQTASVSTTAPITAAPTAEGAIEPGGFDFPALTTVAPVTAAPTLATLPPVVDVQLIVPWPTGDAIDARYTCDGEDVSPELSWTATPEGTVEIAVALTDDDAPDFVHWVLAKIDPLSTLLAEGAVPEFAIQGLNGTGEPGYTGPCPPEGETHTYHYTVFFLGQETTLGGVAPGDELLAEVRARAFDSATVSGTYSRS